MLIIDKDHEFILDSSKNLTKHSTEIKNDSVYENICVSYANLLIQSYVENSQSLNKSKQFDVLKENLSLRQQSAVKALMSEYISSRIDSFLFDPTEIKDVNSVKGEMQSSLINISEHISLKNDEQLCYDKIEPVSFVKISKSESSHLLSVVENQIATQYLSKVVNKNFNSLLNPSLNSTKFLKQQQHIYYNELQENIFKASSSRVSLNSFFNKCIDDWVQEVVSSERK